MDSRSGKHTCNSSFSGCSRLFIPAKRLSRVRAAADGKPPDDCTPNNLNPSIIKSYWCACVNGITRMMIGYSSWQITIKTVHYSGYGWWPAVISLSGLISSWSSAGKQWAPSRSWTGTTSKQVSNIAVQSSSKSSIQNVSWKQVFLRKQKANGRLRFI